jgi:histone arginine demethylase JMJD6
VTVVAEREAVETKAVEKDAVERVGDISHEEFMTRFLKPGVPVIFKNASSSWKARELFTPEWFRKTLGDKRKTIHGVPYTMRELMDLVEASTPEKPAPYPLIWNIDQDLPELLPLLDPMHVNYCLPNWLNRPVFQVGKWGGNRELFVGGAGSQFPYAHIDLYHLSAWINQLYGDKEFIVFPFGQDEYLYPKPNEPWKSQVNIFNPDYEKHPKFRHATPIKFTIHPGETLYVPFGMWHTAYSKTPTISVAFDQLSSANYSKFMKDVWMLKKRSGGLPKALAMYSYALVMGNTCRIQDGLRSKAAASILP